MARSDAYGGATAKLAGDRMGKSFAADMKGGIRTTGETKGKSNALGHGGRAQQLKDKGVPAGVIGELARKAKAAPGQVNYHGKRGGK